MSALLKAQHILRQYAAGLTVSEDDLDWAVQMALNNPGRLKK